jgi:hypothetical protein
MRARTRYSIPVIIENYGDRQTSSQFRNTTLEDLAEENFVDIRSLRTTFGEQEMNYKARNQVRIPINSLIMRQTQI